MKKIAIIKKKEVILGILAISLMIIGFVSYNPNMENQYGKIADVGNYSERLGDATLVSSNGIVDEEIIENNIENQTNTTQENEEEQPLVNYFVEAKMERNNTYSETIEIYEKMLENSNITNDQKAIAQNEISNITNEKKTIQSAENLIKMKGFEDVVIFKNVTGISVIVRSDVLVQEQVSQIQNIIEREFQIDSKNINITNK